MTTVSFSIEEIENILHNMAKTANYGDIVKCLPIRIQGMLIARDRERRLILRERQYEKNS